MVMLTGVQDIPSEWLDAYRATLTEKQPDGTSRKRYPYRLPKMQEGGPDVKPNQTTQRERFKSSIAKFNTISDADKQRWYAARPPWSSFLWYYNYFIMSDLMGNANITQGGVGLIKTIQFKTMSIGAGTAEGSVAITAVDINKAVVMLFGASVISREAENWAQAITVYPYLSSMASELVKCKWSLPSFAGTNTSAATVSLIVIEYI